MPYFCAVHGCKGEHASKWQTCVRRQFNCSDPSERCDYCGLRLDQHETGNYYCPKDAPRIARRK